MKKLINFFMDEEGATAVEYAVMVAAIAAVVVTAAQLIGTNTRTTFNSVATDLVIPPS